MNSSPFMPGQVDVGDDQVPVAPADELERLLGAGGPAHVAERPEQLHEQRREDLVVLDEQDCRSRSLTLEPSARL